MRSFVDMDLEPRREASSVQLRSWGKALPVSVVFRNRKGIWGEREGGGERDAFAYQFYHLLADNVLDDASSFH